MSEMNFIKFLTCIVLPCFIKIIQEPTLFLVIIKSCSSLHALSCSINKNILAFRSVIRRLIFCGEISLLLKLRICITSCNL